MEDGSAAGAGAGGGGQAVCPTPQFVFATAGSYAVERCEPRCDGGVLPRVGVLVASQFDENVRARVRPKVFGRDGLSINLLELLAMTVTAWAFTVQAAAPPDSPGASILMRGDNSSGVH